MMEHGTIFAYCEGAAYKRFDRPQWQRRRTDHETFDKLTMQVALSLHFLLPKGMCC